VPNWVIRARPPNTLRERRNQELQWKISLEAQRPSESTSHRLVEKSVC
jgi:hypothetical protein